MSFMHWWENILYYPDGLLNMNQEFYRKVNAMPEARSIWQFTGVVQRYAGAA